MERREFVRAAMAAGVGAGALGAEGKAMAQTSAKTGQELYQLRKYALRNGPQTALTQGYLERALIPALGRLGMGPVGAFKLDIGPETPTYYVLIPATDAAALVELDARLGADVEYVKAAAGFRDAPATAPAFERSERSLLGAFTGWPKLVAPKMVDGKLPKRIFQLRTYESPSQAAHARKVAMFNETEIGIFVRTGLTPGVFRRHFDWDTDAQPDLHADLCRHSRADGEVGGLRSRCGVEGAVAQAGQYGRGDCKQHRQSVSESAGVLADLVAACWLLKVKPGVCGWQAPGFCLWCRHRPGRFARHT